MDMQGHHHLVKNTVYYNVVPLNIEAIIIIRPYFINRSYLLYGINKP